MITYTYEDAERILLGEGHSTEDIEAVFTSLTVAGLSLEQPEGDVWLISGDELQAMRDQLNSD